MGQLDLSNKDYNMKYSVETDSTLFVAPKDPAQQLNWAIQVDVGSGELVCVEQEQHNVVKSQSEDTRLQKQEECIVDVLSKQGWGERF